MKFDNIVLHYYPSMECVAKCEMNFRNATKITFRACMRDPQAAMDYINSRRLTVSVKTITHRKEWYN